MKKVLLISSLLLFFIGFSQNKLEDKTLAKQPKKSITFKEKKDSPLYLVNKKIVSEKVVKKLNPDHIKSINIYKGDEALERFGKKAKNGVVVIVMKTHKKILENTK